jgi:hypothetical protein
MSHTPNRLEDNWEKIKPLILKEWDLLNEADLEYIDREFDRLVQMIRQRYGGRVEIVQEAAIRNALNALLAKVES